MGNKVLWMVILALVLPMAAFADSDITMTANNGTLVGSSFGMTLSGDQLLTLNGFGGSFSGTNLGSLAFSTGLMNAPGNVIQGATFFTGGTVTVFGNGSNGGPSGVLFSGAFSQAPSWTRVTMADGTNRYTFAGMATGLLSNGSTTADLFIQVIVDKPGGKIFTGTSSINSMTATAVRVPEPGSLGLMGAGLVGLMGAVRRRYKNMAPA